VKPQSAILGAFAVVLLILTSIANAGEERAEALLKKLVANLQELTDTLASIKDQKTAESARARLLEIDKRHHELVKESMPLEKNLTIEMKRQLRDKYDASLSKLQTQLQKEIDRLGKVTEAYKVLEEITLLQEFVQSRMQAARIRAKTLTLAVEAFAANNNAEYPENLEALLDPKARGGPYLRDRTALLDPWGRLYQYDVAGKRNGGVCPDIWSQGPRPGDPASIIGNWPEPKKK
jgi:hypothetical protein